MVTTCFPATSDIAMLQERIASPLRCTVQAPQSATPQPNFVPVRPSSSRKYHMRGIDGSPSNVRPCPLTVTLTIRPSAGGSFASRAAASQPRNVAESAAGPGVPPQAVTKTERLVCQYRVCRRLFVFVFFLLVKRLQWEPKLLARDGSKRIGVNKTNSKTRTPDGPPVV